MARREIVVRFKASATDTFDYLADPRNRPDWQSSLKGVDMLSEGEPRVGMAWKDRTAAGVVPLMEITEFERPTKWTEAGTWRGITAVLELDFRAVSATETDVVARFSLLGSRLWKPFAAGAQWVAAPAVRSDLKRAAKIVSKR